MDKKAFYLTTTLPYVNDKPHIGFALEIVQADILARYWRSLGKDVFFTTGTDEHGQKIFQKAKETGTDVQEYVDRYAAEFGKLRDALDLSYDAFIRTTDEKHVRAAQELWKRCEAAGDIYKKSYKGLYCVGDEAYVKEGDLVNGRCPNHPNQDPIEIEEENYFFRLSHYQDRLLEYLSSADVIVPAWRREEAISFVQQGLEDFSISRETARMSWGIPVPGDEAQVMYVWFDALTNYISTLDWPSSAKATEGKPDLFEKYWVNGVTYQMAGKDQVRFQSIMWQAMLMSAGIPTTQHVLYHGFITSGGQKMSKSIGNVIEPYALVEEYGTDAVRYFLARHIHPFEDSDFTMERFKDLYNADLANGLGNQAARIMKLAQDNLDGPVELSAESLQLQKPFCDLLDQYDFAAATGLIWEHITKADGYIQEKKPFSLVKSDETREEGKQIIARLVNHLAMIATHLAPIMPETATKIMIVVRENKKPENLFARKE
ncbi:methionine--tRNA ligase [Candidatus Kaiserbacteria bacterium]|nr:methionine--tRNA ligase [Candidatus Kaiserbacteria bacterium]